jgi:hypothetical protein
MRQVKMCKFIWFTSNFIFYIFNLKVPINEFLLFFNLNNIFNFSDSKNNYKLLMFAMRNDSEDDSNLLANIESSQASSSTSLINHFNSSNSSLNTKTMEENLTNTDSTKLDNIDDKTKDYVSDSESESDISIKTKRTLALMRNSSIFNFRNFNRLALDEKHYFVEKKMYLKGLESSLAMEDWLVNLLSKTSGNRATVEKVLDDNLNHILKMERNAQLENCGFIRNKPFLITQAHKTPLVYPHVIPLSKKWKDYDDID